MNTRAVSICLTLCALAVPCRAADVAVPPALAAAFADGGDRVVRQAFVPDPDHRVGEVRLIQRGDAVVVQTLLYTRILSRVVAEIEKKETTNWAPPQPGSEDAARYVAALRAAREAVYRNTPRSDPRDTPRQKMLIEFLLRPSTAAVYLGGFDMAEEGGSVRVTGRRPLAVLELSRRYVSRNMRLIVADSFHLPESEVDGLLGPLASLLRSH